MIDDSLYESIPPDMNLKNFPYFLLNVRDFLNSDVVCKLQGEEFQAAMMLFLESWHQVPAGTLPDDNILLARLAGYGRQIKPWLKIRDRALLGWSSYHYTGRIVHPFVLECAFYAWGRKIEFRWRRFCQRERKAAKAGRRPPQPIPTLEEYVTEFHPMTSPIWPTVEKILRDRGDFREKDDDEEKNS